MIFLLIFLSFLFIHIHANEIVNKSVALPPLYADIINKIVTYTLPPFHTFLLHYVLNDDDAFINENALSVLCTKNKKHLYENLGWNGFDLFSLLLISKTFNTQFKKFEKKLYTCINEKTVTKILSLPLSKKNKYEILNIRGERILNQTLTPKLKVWFAIRDSMFSPSIELFLKFSIIGPENYFKNFFMSLDPSTSDYFKKSIPGLKNMFPLFNKLMIALDLLQVLLFPSQSGFKTGINIDDYSSAYQEGTIGEIKKIPCILLLQLCNKDDISKIFNGLNTG